MRNRKTVTALVLCIVCLAGIAAASETDSETTVTVQQEPCCFENPRYSGTCQVTPGEDESCSSILAYLNNPNSVGKAYCGNTKVRGGWSQVSCDGSASTATATAETCTEDRE